MVKKIFGKLRIKEANAELQKAIAKELENDDEKELESLLYERETDKDNTEGM